MSLLTAPLPETVRVCGRDYPVHADFRDILSIYETLSAHTDGEHVRALRALRRFYGNTLPPDLGAAAEALRAFLTPRDTKPRARKTRRKEGRGNSAPRPPDFCFTQDAPLIFAAFYEQYGLDLLQIKFLHWYAFLALFSALSPETRFGEVRACRTQPITGDMPPARRAYLMQMKQAYALERAEDADVEALTQTLLHGGSLQDFLDQHGKGETQHGTGRKH